MSAHAHDPVVDLLAQVEPPEPLFDLGGDGSYELLDEDWDDR